MRIIHLILSLFFLTSCGYRVLAERGIYGGEILSLDVPIFKNLTKEPHISAYVTEAFCSELLSLGLFEINKGEKRAQLEGTITDLKVSHEAFGREGIVIQKRVEVSLNLSLYKEGRLLKTWNLKDSEYYSVEDKNLEDYNKREAIKRASKRLAKVFSSFLLMEY